MVNSPQFHVVPGVAAAEILDGQEYSTIDIIKAAYRAHGMGQTINPPSYFLRFPDHPSDRIIALPAALTGDGNPVDGVKWISSFPGNLSKDLPRASAILILNDAQTGYPFSCLEASIISATRTAASAALAADLLRGSQQRPRTVTYFGGGLIAKYVHHYLIHSGWHFDTATVFDVNPTFRDAFAERLSKLGGIERVDVVQSPEQAIRASELVIFATTAGEPHISEPAWFDHAPIVLHLSLRDLTPEVILSSVNVVDDIEHCLKANTSTHLAEQLTGSRDFIAATLPQVMAGQTVREQSRPIVFSPFGLGVLDLALGLHLYHEAMRRGLAIEVPNFFSELSRYA